MNKNYFILPVIAVIVFISCRNPGSGESVKFQLYFAQGENIYLARCSNCHQKSGEGLGLVYPPLKNADYMEKNLDQVICLIKKGRKGEIIVNGNQFNQPMPGVPTLTDLEEAELLTYIYNTFGHSQGIVEVPVVEKGLKKCIE